MVGVRALCAPYTDPPNAPSEDFDHAEESAPQELCAGMNKYLIVGFGGFLGSIARFWLGGYIYERVGARFPYGTFIVNCSGCFAIGLIMAILTERTHLSPVWRLLIPIGFIGGYTTFSTFEYETFMAMREGALVAAFLNIILSVIVGFACVWVGTVCGRAIA